MEDPDLIQAVFGRWQFSPLDEQPGISFDLEGAPEEQVPVWHSDFSIDPVEADAQLAEMEGILHLSSAALDDVPARIDALVIRAQQMATAGVSFSPAALEALPDPEAAALDLIQTINMPAAGLSFSPGGEEQGKLQAAFDEFRSDLDQLLRLVTNFAWVETQLDGSVVGHSVVSWTGDLDTSWKTALKAEVHQLHKRSLNHALATRNLALHAVTVTVKSAAKLAVLLATPGGAFLALPVAWKFVKQILADVQQYKQLTKIPI